MFDHRVKQGHPRTNENQIVYSSDIVFKVTVNLTSEKWDKSLATGKSNQKRDRLMWKIKFGVSKTILLGYTYVPEKVSCYVSPLQINTLNAGNLSIQSPRLMRKSLAEHGESLYTGNVRNLKAIVLHQIRAAIAPSSKQRKTYRDPSFETEVFFQEELFFLTLEKELAIDIMLEHHQTPHKLVI